MCEGAGGNCPPQFEKLRVAKLNCPPFGNKFKKKTCLLRMEAYKCPVTQGYKDNWIMVCIETIVTFFIAAQTNKEYILVHCS